MVLTLTLLAGLTPVQPAAAADKALLCQQLKIRAVSVLAKCQLKVRSKAEASGNTPDFSKCTAKLERLFATAEQRIGGSCPTSGDSGEVLQQIDDTTALLVERLSGRAVCGNGILDIGEECDGADLGGLNCGDFGHIDGTLKCSQNCTMNLGGCGHAETCGTAVCRENQECRIHQIAVPYCADSCAGIVCRDGERCGLVARVCGDNEPCPPIAECIPDDRCASIACARGQECRIWGPTGEPYCADTCDVCGEDETCDYIDDQSCTDAGVPCPPLVQCTPGDPCDALSCPPHASCEIDPETGTPFCRDSCDGFPCADGQHCELRDVLCVTAPCPPVAVCVDDAPCDALECRPGQECRVLEETNEAYCADTCADRPCPCPPGHECELVDVVCVRAPCPPVARCVPIPDDPCGLEADRGPCQAYIPRWFHNDETGQCERFVYGGCGGNQNNFRSRLECAQRCPEDSEPCEQEVDDGPCQAAIPRWYYNGDHGRCERFIYGGCGGNDNNFASLQECEGQCGAPPDTCELPKETGPCEAYIPRWYFNEMTARCESFVYGGCGGNQNNFVSQAACEKRCDVPTCEQPIEVGPCDAAIPRYGFNSETGKCELFTYGGCQGNDNNFVTRDECAHECEPACERDPDPGNCANDEERWYYDTTTNHCQSFVWTGCGGNTNNFESREDCQERCGGNPCDLPKEDGPCDAAIPRWFFDEQTGECQEFIYGGCGGNDNNFRSEEQCYTFCGTEVPTGGR